MMQSWAHLKDLNVPEVDSKDVTILLGANVVNAILHREIQTQCRAYRLGMDINRID
jgi:hypothetical protein